MKAHLSILVTLFLSLVKGQVFHWGPCPQPAVQPNFSLCKYLGRWYVIEKLPTSFERGKCMEVDYSVRTDGTIRVLNIQQIKGVPRSSEGTGVVEDIHQPAKLGVSFSYFTPYSPYWILSTDYDTSAVVYSCIDILRIFHVDYAWILGRTRSLPEKTVIGSKNILIASNVDVIKMNVTDQQNCDKVFGGQT